MWLNIVDEKSGSVVKCKSTVKQVMEYRGSKYAAYQENGKCNNCIRLEQANTIIFSLITKRTVKECITNQ